jgi:hypothetical protein
MTKLDINSITGASLPLNLYACDVYGNQCVLIATITTAIPPPIEIILPAQFNTAPALGLKLIDSIGCEKFGIIYCDDKAKIFQDGVIFIFMDADIYIFEDQ